MILLDTERKKKMTINRQIKYSGELNLAGQKIKCHVLEDGTRVIEEKNFNKVENLLFGLEIKCYFCNKDIPEIAEILEKIELKNPTPF